MFKTLLSSAFRLILLSFSSFFFEKKKEEKESSKEKEERKNFTKLLLISFATIFFYIKILFLSFGTFLSFSYKKKKEKYGF
ncbi:MAG: hypothetical protein J6M62_01045 [Selenomonadaceae bacterium]|nr:hypothetical protein [Selenomonadaceae bacterium]